MGLLRFDGVRFVAYPEDHAPVHLHGFHAGTEVIVELRRVDARLVAIAGRKDAIRPANSSRGDVRHVLEVAAQHFDRLMELWEEAHG